MSIGQIWIIITVIISSMATLPLTVENIVKIDKDMVTVSSATIVTEEKETPPSEDQGNSGNNSTPNPLDQGSTETSIKMMKDVGEAYMDKFGLSDSDFKMMKDAGINVIEGNFDICASDEDVQYFLDESAKFGMKVVMPAGSGEAEWSYECDKEPFPKTQKPVWNKDGVVAWINKWKSNPNIYAWDTSNEAGSVLPNPSPENMLTVDQLKQAYSDVKAADASHPVMIRMNGWYFYDYESDFFRPGNPFDKGVADIVMVNAYSNVDEYFDDFVQTLTDRSLQSVHAIDPNASILVALGVWEEPPIWTMPTVEHLQKEINTLKGYNNILGIAYFKYGAKGSEWYLPDATIGAPNLFNVISKS